MASRIRQGDTVVVIAGKDKGKKGDVVTILPKKGRVIVRSVNTVKRHTRPTQKNPQGGIIEKEAPLQLSNVMVLDPKDQKPCRVRFEVRDGAKVRVSVRSGMIIPEVMKTAAPA